MCPWRNQIRFPRARKKKEWFIRYGYLTLGITNRGKTNPSSQRVRQTDGQSVESVGLAPTNLKSEGRENREEESVSDRSKDVSRGRGRRLGPSGRVKSFILFQQTMESRLFGETLSHLCPFMYRNSQENVEESLALAFMTWRLRE